MLLIFVQCRKEAAVEKMNLLKQYAIVSECIFEVGEQENVSEVYRKEVIGIASAVEMQTAVTPEEEAVAERAVSDIVDRIKMGYKNDFDIDITNEIAKGLKNFGALLIEHIIITRDSYFSFLEEGLI